MLHKLLYAQWDEPISELAFELPYSEVMSRIALLASRILKGMAQALENPGSMPSAFFQECLEFYILVPGLVNITLNYKVCIEQGLPLHPTCYFKVSDKSRFQTHHQEGTLNTATELYLDSIETARSLYRLEENCLDRLQHHVKIVPPQVADFIYTSRPDKYTWRASDPHKIRDLAASIQQKTRPTLLLGAAHGSIMSGLLLANILETSLYFIRFSLFKRSDTAPVIAPSDLEYLSKFREGPVVFFDEDIAKGTTMREFTTFLQPFFLKTYSAGVLRHRYSEFVPDFTGKVWD